MAKIEIYVRIRPTGHRFSALTSSQSSQTVQVMVNGGADVEI